VEDSILMQGHEAAADGTNLTTKRDAAPEPHNVEAGSPLGEALFWLQATLDDIRDLDFESPIAECVSADCSDLSTLYREAAKLHEKLGDEAAAPAARVFAMLAAVTNFHFNPSDRVAPFGAMLVMEDGRSAIPEDFRGAPVQTLAHAARRAANSVLRARLSDVCWLLERNRHDLGRAAVAAYVSVVEGLDSLRRNDHPEEKDPILGLTARDVLTRALTIGRAVGWENEEVLAARRWISAVRARAIKDVNPAPVHWFYEIDLDFGVSAPEELGVEIERFLASRADVSNSHMMIELWRLAARAYHHAKDDDGKYRCRVAAAEALVSEAERHTSAMLASHWMSEAIAEYGGIPGKRERRTELRHKLIDVQSGISEEMSSFSQPMDLREIINHVENQCSKKKTLIDLLLLFADLEQSPQPDKLVSDAVKSISRHPLASLFGTSFHDQEGKVTHRSKGGGFGDDQNSDAIRVQVAQRERTRRQLHSFGQVEVARREITNRFYLGDDTFQALLRHSVFVPHDLIDTFSRGFRRFFEGDFTSAIYILTPLLENSLRHVLKMNGYDVTTFDDAKQVQEDRTISALFQQMRLEMEEIFGEAITTDIDNVFLSKPGPSLRHALAHGLLSDGSPSDADAIYACWFIFRLCCIPLFEHRAEIELPE
jgi:hypothetical protein